MKRYVIPYKRNMRKLFTNLYKTFWGDIQDNWKSFLFCFIQYNQIDFNSIDTKKKME